MDDPLTIMDEIKADLDDDKTWPLTAVLSRWQSLRTALEAQAEELAQKEARIARLHEQLQEYHDNAHYDGEDLYIGCCITEAQYQHCEKLLNESPAQSAAHLKAEALRELADEQKEAAQQATNTMQTGAMLKAEYAELAARNKADRIEREAKES